MENVTTSKPWETYLDSKRCQNNDPMAEKIWKAESFPIHGKSKSKWLTYNMAMRARVFDDWTEEMLRQNKDALVLHIGCGLDSRFLRIFDGCIYGICRKSIQV